MVDLKSFEVWFLTGSQDLYGEAALKQVAEHSREIAAHLDGSGLLPVRVVWKPTLKSPEAILDLCREANAAARCVGVITWMHTFSPAKMWIAGLSRLEKPLAHLHTQYNAELPWDTIDMDFMNLNQSAHGDREFGYIGARLRIERKVVVGHWKDEEVASRLDVWARAACAIIDARRLKIVRFGGMNMREVAVTGGDRVEAQVRLGWSVNGYGVGDLVARMAGVSDAEIDGLVGEYEEKYAVAPALRKGGPRHADLRYAARQEAGIRAFLVEGGFGGFTTTFEDLHGLEHAARPGLSAPDGRRLRLRSGRRLEVVRPRPGPEGDGLRVARGRLLHGGLHLPPGEGEGARPRRPHARGLPFDRRVQALARDPSPQHRRQGRSLPARVRRRDRPRRERGHDRHPAAACGWSRTSSKRWRPTGPMPKLPVARAVWIPRPDFKRACEAWILAGGAHHCAHSRALTMAHLEDFAAIAGVELVGIGAKTEVAALKNELRWNDVAYKLAH